MAKYEKTRTYVVKSIGKVDVTFAAPKGRKYQSLIATIHALPVRVAKALKVGKKVTFHRFSNQYTTYFAPKA